MKKTILTSVIAFCFVANSYSQDVITKKNGEDIQSKILEVNLTEIKYKKFDYQDGPTFVILKSDVLMVRYENGTKDIFNEQQKTNESSTSNLSDRDLFIKGQSDATYYYDGYKPAGTGTLVTSLLSPLVGLIPAIACSSTKPKEANLNYPNAELMKKADYYNGYTHRAKKIKQGKVWTNFGIAFGINLVFVLLLSPDLH